MPIALDRRTRSDADLRTVTPDEFFDEQLPALIARHGALVARGMLELDARPLAVEVEDRAWTFSTDGTTLLLGVGAGDDAVVVTLTGPLFSDWVQQQIGFNGLAVSGQMRSRNGSEHDLSVWDSLWMTLLEGWPTVDPDLTFLDEQGRALDLGRTFTPADDPEDVAHFLREAGYLHLRGWVDPQLMARVSDDIDRAVPHYAEGDGKSWWSSLVDGTRRCVRLQEFLPHSPTTEAILRSPGWDQLRTTLGDRDALVQAPVEGRCLEALIKPIGVDGGSSDIPFHRDCHFGRHAYSCSALTVGIAVTGSSHENGLLRVVAGSHRVAMPIEVAKSKPYLPVIGVPTEPGDLTVHLSCTLHEATPPRTSERKVMYGGNFSLAPRPGDGRGNAAHLLLRESINDNAPVAQAHGARSC